MSKEHLFDKQSFKEKCDYCKKFSHYYTGYEDKVICEECYNKERKKHKGKEEY